MNNWSVTMLIVAALATPVAIAAESPPAAHTDRESSQGPWEDREQHCAAHAQKNLDALQQQLHLKDNQQTTWATYKTYVLSQLDERAKHHEQHRGAADAVQESLSAPERLQKLVAHLRARADELEKLGKQTDVFYKTLSPEQKTIFDLHWQYLQHHSAR